VTPLQSRYQFKVGVAFRPTAFKASIDSRGPERTDIHCSHRAGRIRPPQPTVGLARGAKCVGEVFPTHSFPLPAQNIPTVCNDNTVLGLLFAGWDDPVDESGGTA
jgi:hypothetical protein